MKNAWNSQPGETKVSLPLRESKLFFDSDYASYLRLFTLEELEYLKKLRDARVAILVTSYFEKDVLALIANIEEVKPEGKEVLVSFDIVRRDERKI